MKPSLRVELPRDELDALLQRVQQALSEADYQRLKALIDTLLYLTQLLESKTTSIRRLRQMLFGASTEKTRKVLKNKPHEGAARGQEGAGANEPSGGELQPSAVTPDDPSAPRPGHGRNGAQDYPGADKVKVEHPSLKPADRCPECKRGKVYAMAPGSLVRITGQAPLHATVYELEKLRCNLCGEVFTAPSPAGLDAQKYDARAASMIALLKYGSGLPFNRLQRLQGCLDIPLPASTQWEIAEAAAGVVKPAHQELIRQAAQGEVMHNDDTPNKILALMAENARNDEWALSGASAPAQRTGIFTSGIVATLEQHPIALFFTGRQHAGENLAKVLAQRATTLDPPIQMCDALSRNLAPPFKTILGKCNSHARRKFVEVVPSFPSECEVVLKIFAQLYKNDDLCKQQRLSPDQRLHWHQAESSPLMHTLRHWCDEQLEQHKVEPNSGLGQAITYLRNHWEGLTLFLRQAAAPLDNNLCERVLKMAILHRKNSMFFKTQNGADVGDLFMSLIYTCQLCAVNAFDYLTALQEHHAELSKNPALWMPWNYRETMARAGIT